MQPVTYDSIASLPTGRLRVSIVCYACVEQQLRKTVDTLLCAIQVCLEQGSLQAVDVFFVDNGPNVSERQKIESIIADTAKPAVVRLLYCGSGENIGFGAGHNLTFDSTQSEFHLVLNPDVELAPDALCEGLKFMGMHHDCGIIAPAVVNSSGSIEYLCKRYPTVLDLVLRGFAPVWLCSIFRRRLARYEMRDVLSSSVVWCPQLISGCFMLLRAPLLARLKGFSSQYFLYFEDFDLSLRAAEVCKIAYVPAVKIIHYGGYAAHKGSRHIFLFIRSAITFFNTHGWKWC